MALNTSYKRKYELYKEHLATIKGLKFTFREIDILVCILHNRGEKKIASLLSISPRTVGVHVYNIMNKLACNSKDQIIDFMESSGKLPLFREYYSHLLINSNFEKQLTHVARRINPNETTFYCYREDALALDEDLYQSIQKHLNLAHIKLVEIASNENNSPIFELRNISETRYYHDLLRNLLEALNPPQKEQILIEFDDAYQKIENMHDGKTESAHDEDHQKVKKANQNAKLFSIDKISHNKILFAVGGAFLCILCFMVLLRYNSVISVSSSSEVSGVALARSELPVPHEDVLLDRLSLISEMDAQFRKGKQDIKALALVGIGGSGKTVIARQYARRQDGVVWEINAETPRNLKESFENFASLLAVTVEDKRAWAELKDIRDPQEKEEKIILFVKKRLKANPGWLIIFDNVEKFTDIGRYFPSDSAIWGKGKVIITTRNSNMETHNAIHRTIPVQELTPEEKLSLFSKILHGVDAPPLTFNKEKTKTFLSTLPSFPLDISVAAYYLKATSISYQEYLDRLIKTNNEFVEMQGNILNELTEYTKTRYGIITLSLKVLIDKHKDFTDLLLLIGLLDSQNILRDLLNQYKSPDIVDNFIYNLKKHSLITTHSLPCVDSTLSIHRSTQAIIVAYLTKQLNLQKNNGLIESISSFLKDYAVHAIDTEDLLKEKQLINHLEMFLTHDNILTNSVRSVIYSELGIAYYYLGFYLKAKRYLEKSKELVESDNVNKNFKNARLFLYLGNCYRALGEYERAKSFLEKSFNLYKTMKVGNTVYMAKVLAYLGNFYRDIGDYEKAKNFLEQSITVYEAYEGKNSNYSPYIGVIFSYLGNLYRDTGHYEKSKNFYEKSLRIYQKHLAKDHLKTARVLGHLGTIYRELGDYKTAKNFLNQSLIIYRKHLTEDHGDIGWILVLLADTHRESGEYKDAELIIKNALYIYEKIYSANQSDLAWVYFVLGKIYISLGKYKEANKYLESALTTYKKHYGNDHLDTAHLLNSLGLLCILENDFDKAESLLKKSLAIYHTNGHCDTYKVLENLAELYVKKSIYKNEQENTKYDKTLRENSINYLKKSLEIIKNNFSKNSPHIIRIQSKLDDYTTGKNLK